MRDPGRDLAAYTEQYRELPFEATQAAIRRRFVLERIALHAPKRILEVGCGLAPLFTDLPSVEFTVVEPAEEFARLAARQARAHGRAHVHAGYLDTLETDARGFDMMLVSSLLHELADAQALLAQVHRFCSPRTVLHVNVPNALSVHRLMAVAMGLIASPYERSATQQRMQQHGTYDLASLAGTLAQAGFVVFERGSYFVKPFTHAQMQQLQDSGFLDAKLLKGLEGLAAFLPDNGSEIFVEARLQA